MNSYSSPTELGEAFARTRWSWLRSNIREQLEQRPDAAKVTIVTTDLLPAAVQTLQWLLKLPTPLPERITIGISKLDRALLERTDCGLSTRPLLEALDGPLDNHRARRRETRQAATDLWTTAAQHPIVASTPALQRWIAAESTLGALPAQTGLRQTLLTDALTVLEALPSTGITVTRFAATVLGSAHALDKGPMASLVLRALTFLYEQPATATLQPRRLWKRAGLRPDDLSSRVLLAGFSPAGRTPLETILGEHSAHGLPAVITLRLVEDYLATRPGPLLAPDVHVWACENVAVAAEATRELGSACPPLICIEGWPSHAAVALLSHLVQHGSAVGYHGDFDWDGLAIADQMMQYGATPWRMGAEHYRGAALSLTKLMRLEEPVAQIAPPSWAPTLATTMSEVGWRVEEEHVMNDLLADLRGAP
ncbi:uncharacterized protein (TIGR02679 family) [Hamadaea flava]|uniref:TIGR02679 family protein n=1 Tax=Hamadaea flava TaxID=1742688 RepID=A0ABV8LXM5_9ACTN|nr:TIGR02679 family protein [Hamadaea flava]MCP2323442.1 uncharacterized protein (TIGR02679 family) [Hamadaea flava]